MHDDVIIMGAGASCDAGIPLLGNFVERLRTFAYKGSSDYGPLSIADINIFKDAINVLDELDNYHGRAAFDDWNIEDVLSVLQFNKLGDEEGDKKFRAMVKAITRTIELSCKINDDNERNNWNWNNYYLFWLNIFERYKLTSSLPTIITFNYDLVLERSLFAYLQLKETNYNKHDGFSVRYYYDPRLDQCFKFNNSQIYKRRLLKSGKYDLSADFIRDLQLCEIQSLTNPVNIEFLKLHGSLNFPEWTDAVIDSIPFLSESIESPYIIPPITNKQVANEANLIWKTALLRLREVKNIVIVGYSMPTTDIYMQSFLKTALGPNRCLNRITVFDPILFEDPIKGQEMKKRYEVCFSENIRNRINFQPNILPETRPGSFCHFAKLINKPSSGIFY